MLTKEEGLLDWRQPAAACTTRSAAAALARAYSRLDGQTLKIIRADYVERAHAWNPHPAGGGACASLARTVILPEKSATRRPQGRTGCGLACGLKAATCKLD